MSSIRFVDESSTALDSYVAELGDDISYEKSLSSSRFLKTILVRHDYGLLVLKLFIKPDPLMPLRVIQRRLKNQRDVLQDVPNVLAYSTFVETDKAGYLIRQYAGSSLYDRISTRPYLASIEKKWIAFQILAALRDAHARDVPHGDLKSENVLITPSLSVLVTDFASAFKPTYLPLDDPSDFSYFYDSSGRRTCYLAPERFYEEGAAKISQVKRDVATALSLAEAAGTSATGIGSAKRESSAFNQTSSFPTSGAHSDRKNGKITEAMDVFSAACVLVEIWTDGAGLFNLSELFAYRRGEMAGMEAILDSIEDLTVRTMISVMLALESTHRPSFDGVLEDNRNTVFPDYFYTFLPDYVTSLATPSAGPTLTGGSKAAFNPADRFVEQADIVLMRMSQDWEGIISSVLREHAMSTSRLDEPFLGQNEDVENGTTIDDDGPALLLLNLITSNVRNCLRASSRLSAFAPIWDLARWISTEHLSDRIVPYLVALTRDEVGQVRAGSCRLLTELLQKVDSVSIANLELIPGYIIPNIRHLAEDEDVYVRCSYAEALPVLAEVGLNMLEMGEALRSGAIHGAGSYDDWKDPDYDATANELRLLIEEQAAALLVDTSSEVKRAALSHASKLCDLFGRQRTDEVLLSRMITYLNDQDWRLRQSFLSSIVDVAAFVGTTSLEEFVLPLMEQALADSEDAVVAKVLSSLASIVNLGLFTKARYLEILSCVLGFLCHPSAWIRQGSASLVSTIASQLSADDVWCLVYPSIRPLLNSDIVEISEQEVLDSLIEPLSRPILDSARSWAQNSGPKSWWYQETRSRPARTDSLRAFNYPSASAMLMSIEAGGSDLDAHHIAGLRERGFKPEDETKLALLRNHIGMQAAIANRRNVPPRAPRTDNMGSFGTKVNLQEHQVMLQTVFIHPAGGNVDSSSVRPPNPERESPGYHRPKLTGPSTSRNAKSRKPSTDTLSLPDTDPVAELRRRLSRLDTDDNTAPTPVIGYAFDSPHTERSVTGPDLHTPAETVASTPMPGMAHRHGKSRAGKSRISTASETSKAAPEISAVRAYAAGRLELSAELRFPASTAAALSSPGPSSDTLRSSGRPITTVPDNEFRTSYDGLDPNIMAYIRSTLTVERAEGLYEYGPIISVAPERKRHLPPKKASGLATNEPEGLIPHMIADLDQHRQSIQGIVVAPDHAFFVSVDSGGTCLVWDVHRLERTVTTMPRLTYQLNKQRITAVSTVPRSHCFIVGGDDGAVEVCRVWTARQGENLRFLRVTTVCRYQLSDSDGYPTCLAPIDDGGLDDFMIGTSKGCLLRLDRVTMTLRSRMRASVAIGQLTCLVVDPCGTWLAAGTTEGDLCLWDLRYEILLRRYRFGTAISTCASHPSRSRKKAVVLACLPDPDRHKQEILLQTVDLASGATVETFTGLGSDGNIDAEAAPGMDLSVSSIAAVSAIAQQVGFAAPHAADASPSAGVCTVLSLPNRQASGSALLSPVAESFSEDLPRSNASHGPGDGIFVLGSEDHVVRWWNLGQTRDSAVICGLGIGGERTYDFGREPSASTWRYVEHIANNSRRRRSRTRGDADETAGLGRSGRQPLKPHLNGISALAVLETPFSGSPVLISGDRSGVLKVWRIEG